MLFLSSLLSVFAAGVAAQVTATGPNGPTNPDKPSLGTPVNQTSFARLISLNAIDDFCLFAPHDPNSIIGETEAEEVAWCVQPRNNARLIPDGTFTAVHFIKTPIYWQIQGWGDLTKLNIRSGDTGGELDPHGATNVGNPVGGNVTTNSTGQDVFYEEWMNYMAFNQFCLRVCIADGPFGAAKQCEHMLDIMGCDFVMPGDYTENSFTECEGEPALPPGVYPAAGGGFSTWFQGQAPTPTGPAMVPPSSNCKTYSTIGNGVSSVAAAASTSGGASNSASAAASSGTGSPDNFNNQVAGGSAKANGAVHASSADLLAIGIPAFALLAGVGAVWL